MSRAQSPTALKVLRGNPGRRPIQPDPVSHEPDLTPPSSLSFKAKKVWKRVAAELHYMGVLKAADVDALAGYCQAVAIMGDLDVGSARWDRVLRTVRLFAHEFGLTPASRAKMSAPNPSDEDDSLLT